MEIRRNFFCQAAGDADDGEAGRGSIVLTNGESRIIDDSNLSSAEGGGRSVLGSRSSVLQGPLTGVQLDSIGRHSQSSIKTPMGFANKHISAQLAGIIITSPQRLRWLRRRAPIPEHRAAKSLSNSTPHLLLGRNVSKNSNGTNSKLKTSPGAPRMHVSGSLSQGFSLPPAEVPRWALSRRRGLCKTKNALAGTNDLPAGLRPPSTGVASRINTPAVTTAARVVVPWPGPGCWGSGDEAMPKNGWKLAAEKWKLATRNRKQTFRTPGDASDAFKVARSESWNFCGIGHEVD